ncbi:oligopeptide ABC transporter permease [Paratissierella segnis]|jgi:peptide/nickel transport system permease protein|uniref:ABC transporter permease n=1 Tax=Paratissierella segnis TaxID=2763679 RepID=A0A926EXI1_9FIRM|nr:oligopeptide ABC transporter permease [Paratissierella segnis]MBC8588229.1 ABC transporter permease [Paratissierella segnis]
MMVNNKNDNIYSSSKKQSYFRDVAKRFVNHKLAIIGLIILTLLILIVTFLPMTMKLDPYTIGRELPYSGPTKGLVLGVDNAGRDNFSRLIYGGRVSLLVGLLSTGISVLIGIPLGIVAGYYGKTIDAIIMRIADIFISFPSIILILVLVSIIGPSMWSIIVIIGIMGWPEFARLIRGNVLSVREKEYVESAKAIGVKDSEIILKYILPNSVAPIIVAATFRVAGAILQESSLSFLGMGVQPPQASWGNMLYGAQSLTVLTTKQWAWIPPGLMLVITICCVNFIGDGLRDALDPRMKI